MSTECGRVVLTVKSDVLREEPVLTSLYAL